MLFYMPSAPPITIRDMYDPSLDPIRVETDAVECGDCSVKIPFRRHARVWLRQYQTGSLPTHNYETYGTLTEDIERNYAVAQERDDIEVSEPQDDSTRLPSRGMKVHAEYTLYGHFYLLRQMFEGADKIRFFLDQDSGMRAVCLGAFVDRIQESRCDAFFVKINKGLTVNEKRSLVAGIKKEWEEAKRQNPGLSESKLKLLLIKQRMNNLMSFGKWQDKWVCHPFPGMNEPEKAMCYLTDVQGYDEDHKAWLYNKASLHAIDRFFMQVRRRLSLLERLIATSSNAGRRWHGYNAYNPAIIIKMLDK